MRRAQLGLAREVLDSVPSEVRYVSAELAELYNRLRHREEAERTGVSVFPEDIPFERRWSGPHFAPDGVSSARGVRWFPARIVTIDEEALELEVGEPPEYQPAPVYTRRPIAVPAFLDAANRRDLRDVFEGQYLDVLIDEQGETILFLRPAGAATRPRDPWDILQGWKPELGDLAAE